MYQTKIKNPILPGFNPDPNILRVGSTYYIAVSSFEWLPGIRVYCSKDLINWEQTGDILTTQVDLRGNPENGSIWAPQLSYADHLFYCIYTDVKNAHGPFKDCHNYLITAPSIKGPWSTPIYLNSSGFDPSLFHDPETGRKWLVNEIWDYRMTTSNKSAGIVLQEFDAHEQRLVGPVTKIFSGTALAKTEAPLIYFYNHYYYLLTAEGGTGKNHSVTVCRSKKIEGPYEVAPNSPILTASDKPTSSFQCCGHASLVQATTGIWYLVYLMTRPLAGQYHILGRETSIQEVTWTDDDWLTTVVSGNGPELTPTIVTNQPIQQSSSLSFHPDFHDQILDQRWNTVRILADNEWLQLHARSGFLRIYGGESPVTTFDHHLLAVRQNSFEYDAATTLNFDPKSFNQMAGLLLYLNHHKFLYLYLTFDEELGRVIRLMKLDQDDYHLFEQKIPIKSNRVDLRFVVSGLSARAEWRPNRTDQWRLLQDNLDLRFLSGGFTGNFIGIAVHDMDRKLGCYADFHHFDYTVDHA